MWKKSLWLRGIKTTKEPKLDKNIEVDVLIIGGGITGLTTAYHLKDTDLSVCIVDQDKVGHGVSLKTTGKLNYLQEVIYSKIENEYSYEHAVLYYKSQRHAIKIVKDIVENEKIDCNFERATSYVFTDKEEEAKTLIKERSILESIGEKVEEHYTVDERIKSVYAISVTNTAVFHPLKYLIALKDICLKHNIKIYESTKIYDIKKEKEFYMCKTNEYEIKAKKVVLACHYPFFILPFFMPIKTYIEKSYITASKVPTNERTTYITSKNPTKSIRYHEDINNYFIYLSNSHKICNHLDEKENFDKTIEEVNKMKLKPEYVWSNVDIMTYDSIPFIGEIKQNLYIGTGYNTWGMTNGTIAGLIISDLILDKQNPYIKLFDPHRKSMANKLKTYPLHLLMNTKGYIQNKVSKDKEWYDCSLKFKKIDGKSVAIYTDKKGEHIVYAKCPHMGCTLVFNEVEKTWDCPCHASRFNIDGKCIKGPSLYNIKYKKTDK